MKTFLFIVLSLASGVLINDFKVILGVGCFVMAVDINKSIRREFEDGKAKNKQKNN